MPPLTWLFTWHALKVENILMWIKYYFSVRLKIRRVLLLVPPPQKKGKISICIYILYTCIYKCDIMLIFFNVKMSWIDLINFKTLTATYDCLTNSWYRKMGRIKFINLYSKYKFPTCSFYKLNVTQKFWWIFTEISLCHEVNKRSFQYSVRLMFPHISLSNLCIFKQMYFLCFEWYLYWLV
jgi:hypothetical protein